MNGDPNRGLLVEPALTTLRLLAEATGVRRTVGDIALTDRPVGMVHLLGEMVLWAVRRVFLLIHVGLCALAARDHQRAEYLADAVAADVAGTEAAARTMDRLILLDSIATLILYNAETTGPARWSTMASSLHLRRERELPRLRQLTRRDTGLWSTHPPSGLRARMIEAWPAWPPAVTLDDEESARIDAELAGWYAATHRRLLGPMAYRGERQPAR